MIDGWIDGWDGTLEGMGELYIFEVVKGKNRLVQ